MMRELDSTTHFPYLARDTCYIVIDNKGTVTSPHTMAEKREAVERLGRREVRIYAAWPGQYRTDLFALTDNKALREAFKL